MLPAEFNLPSRASDSNQVAENDETKVRILYHPCPKTLVYLANPARRLRLIVGWHSPSGMEAKKAETEIRLLF
jgi:hypothetical protein